MAIKSVREGVGRSQDFTEEKRRKIYDMYTTFKGDLPVYKIAEKLDVNPAYLYIIHQKKWFQELDREKKGL